MLLLAWYSWSSRKILHGFSDALNWAYAAVGYIKAVTKYRNISVTFLSSKLRIVPLKKFITITRWELLWNFILPNIIRSAYNSLSEEIFIEEISCCTDSFISLSSISAVAPLCHNFLQHFKLFYESFYFFRFVFIFLKKSCHVNVLTQTQKCRIMQFGRKQYPNVQFAREQLPILQYGR